MFFVKLGDKISDQRLRSLSCLRSKRPLPAMWPEETRLQTSQFHLLVNLPLLSQAHNHAVISSLIKNGKVGHVSVTTRSRWTFFWGRGRLYTGYFTSRYLCVLGGERRLGVRLRRARGLMGREEGNFFLFLLKLSKPLSHGEILYMCKNNLWAQR